MVKLATVMAVVVLGCTSWSSANLLTNGSFELGTAGNGYTPGPVTSGSATGWTISGSAGQVVVEDKTVSNPTQSEGAGYQYFLGASEGNRAIGFNYGGASPGGSIAQTFSTEVGQTYTVAFDYGKYGTSGGDAKLTVSVTGLAAQLFIDSDGSAYSGLASTATVFNRQGSFNFVANAALTALMFTDSTTNNGNGFDLGLDNVRVTLVPEPAAVGPMLVALAAVLRRRRAGRHDARGAGTSI